MNLVAKWTRQDGTILHCRVVGAHSGSGTLTVVIDNQSINHDPDYPVGRIYFVPRQEITVDTWALKTMTVYT